MSHGGLDQSVTFVCCFLGGCGCPKGSAGIGWDLLGSVENHRVSSGSSGVAGTCHVSVDGSFVTVSAQFS